MLYFTQNDSCHADSFLVIFETYIHVQRTLVINEVLDLSNDFMNADKVNSSYVVIQSTKTNSCFETLNEMKESKEIWVEKLRES